MSGTSKHFTARCITDLEKDDITNFVSAVNNGGTNKSSSGAELRFLEKDPEHGYKQKAFYTDDGFDQIWVVNLDEQTGKDRRSCLLIQREAENGHIRSVRAYFDIALEALQALSKGDVTLMQLRNRSMMQGGILSALDSPEAASEKPEALKEVEGLKQSKAPPPEDESDERKILPVFVTGDIDDDLLSSFTRKFSEGYTWLKWTYVTSTSVLELVERASRDDEQENSSQPFKGASTDDVIDFVQNSFPGWALQSKMFLVLDEHTPNDRGVLMGQITKEGVQLVRVPINDAKLLVVSTGGQEPPIEESVADAIEHSDGLLPAM